MELLPNLHAGAMGFELELLVLVSWGLRPHTPTYG